MYSVDWCRRIRLTLEASAGPLRTKQIAMRCGCVTADEYAVVRHALRRLLAQGQLSQSDRGYYQLKGSA
jgi:hypothetical protein